MSSISIKGVVVGALFDTLAGFVGSFIAFLIIGKTTGATTGPEVKAVLDSSSATMIWSSLSTAVIMTAGGYLAARIARKAPLVNGTLSTFLYVLSGLYMPISASYPEYWTRDLIATMSAPFLGLLGGYIYLRRTRNFLQV